MKLSQVLKDWPEKVNDSLRIEDDKMWHHNHGFNTALTSCDREIDREALAKELSMSFDDVPLERKDGIEKAFHLQQADHIISTMPTWLRKVSE